MSNYGLTEAQVIELIQYYSEKVGRDRTIESILSDEIFEDLENSSIKELRSNIQKYTKDAIKYDGNRWTKTGAVNKAFVLKLKNLKMDVYQTI